MNNEIKVSIVCDSACEYKKADREAINVTYAQCTYFLKGREYKADVDWENVSDTDFFNAMKDGEIIRTAQVTIQEWIRVFEDELKKGNDIVLLACSSAISGGINSARLAKDEILEKYPMQKIYIVDTLMGGAGIGLMAYDAHKKIFEQGYSAEQYVEWIEQHKNRFQMVGTVDDCTYLARSGRINGSIAFLTKIFSIKPIVISNCIGQNFSIAKTRGRKASMQFCIDYVKKNITAPEDYPIIVCNAFCADDGEMLRQMVEDQLRRPTNIQKIGPCVGSAVGPGQLCLYFYGEEVDHKYQ